MTPTAPAMATVIIEPENILRMMVSFSVGIPTKTPNRWDCSIFRYRPAAPPRTHALVHVNGGCVVPAAPHLRCMPHRRAPEPCDEFPPSDHSITSSAQLRGFPHDPIGDEPDPMP